MREKGSQGSEGQSADSERVDQVCRRAGEMDNTMKRKKRVAINKCWETTMNSKT